MLKSKRSLHIRQTRTNHRGTIPKPQKLNPRILYHRSNKAWRNPRKPRKRTVKTGTKTVKATSKTIKTAKNTEKTAKAAKKSASTAKEAAKKTAQGIKALGKAIVRGIKAVIRGIAGLIAAIAAGGWIAVIIILFIGAIAFILMSAFGVFTADEITPDKPMSKMVYLINAEHEARIYNNVERLSTGAFDEVKSHL